VAQHRREFSPQFKAEAVQFVMETGRPIAEIARELESGEGTLGNWVNEWKQSNPEPEKALIPVERARVAEMEDEIRRLRLENEFLKRAAAYAGDRCQVGVSPRLARMVS
jgi:transposase-like protein